VRLAAIALLFAGCNAEPMTPRECIRDVADAQMRALAQGIGLCAGVDACVENEIRQRALIMADYAEACAGGGVGKP